jgi:hypothetical protein
MKKRIFIPLAMALLPACAFAIDGVVLINQATVVAAGGFPYIITQPGSYKLSGNLVCCTPKNSNPSVAQPEAIHVAANNVTIDLNGFSILGPGTGFTAGVFAPTFFSHTTVFNGSVVGFADGVSVATFGRVQNVHVSNSNTTGISAGAGSLIIGNVVESIGEVAAGNVGIFVDTGTLVRDNTVTQSAGTGIIVFNCPAAIIANVVSGGNFSISAGPTCTLSQNSPAL